MVLAASGIILENKKILLLQRSNYTENYPGFWGCPGGRAEKGETAQENVIREVKEECNLNFLPTKIIKTGIWQERKYYRFLGNWSGKIIIQEEEVSDYNWFSFEKAMQLQLSFDYKEILEILYKNKYL
ncbi:ADP-ribose pyrophosphatase YjhB (NUDIX family) [Lutibacter oceani]|uniref:ADP-ribose pyrophosphatase YjhB (NUDIX family) n=1 Tax=Lutibacter oceani TaxID=1853311 RepID=A0A3D9RSI6_9FLAO|nr:NUDIX hydrolase [Lutibacter oceani]REE82923.1 ADP-ribose pyrophosphatase YjhB (NUDIX family) [Lutibacter oceani]